MMRLGARSVKSMGSARQAGARYVKQLEAAAFRAVDRASEAGYREVQNTMRGAGLGRLSGAVGMTSALRKRQFGTNPYGVIYARGDRQGRAAKALQAYSEGARITADGDGWMAFQTNALPRRVNGKRMTPEGYNASGLAQRYGKLRFKPISSSVAYLVVRKTTVTGKGRARNIGMKATKRSPEVRDLIMFVLIKETYRAKRFDQRVIMERHGRNVPRLMQEELRNMR